MKITSNTSYTITASQSWINISSTSGSGDKTITVFCDENTSSSPRSGRITITVDYSVYEYIDVTQEASPVCRTKRLDNECIEIPGDTIYHEVVSRFIETCDKCDIIVDEHIDYYGYTKSGHVIYGNSCRDCGYIDMTAPTISLSVSPIKSYYTNETITFTASISDNNNISRVYVTLDDIWISGEYFASLHTTSISASSLTTGTHHIEVTVYDAAGNIGTTTYTIKKTNPKSPYNATSYDYPWATQYQIEYINLVNIYRSWNGAEPLELDKNACLAATELSGYNMWGIAYNFGEIVSHGQFIDSSGFRYNAYSSCNNVQNLFIYHANQYKDTIIDKNHTKLGFALNYDSSGNTYWYILYAY